MKYTINYDANPKSDETKIIWEGISENAKTERSLPPGKPFAFFIKYELNQIKGGCSGYIYYGCFYVDLLWVDQSLRGKQYGTQLMKEAEKLAHDNNSNFIAVNTMNFEALDFYKKLGFTIEFERHGFDKNSIMYFLRKDLKMAINNKAKEAFHWIVTILKKLNIPFQIAGGLAANIYGSRRLLEDIDIDIPEDCFSIIKDEVKDFIVYEPAQFKDETWDLMLMTLNYKGQLIDICGAFHTKIRNKFTSKWQDFHTDFSKSEVKKCFDIDVPVISMNDLLFYKKIIARPVDLIDVEQIETNKELK
ncbi:MAG: GNAT family N-acetyltransferase [Gammaproteobacteria bacterium]|nr:GNAT family N-acetyltransferase [Gammaproteobacteria bacterium]MCW5583941.1 GNAT family N-acetyltransferase [Gammaproteobacteria bacterium]